MQPPAFGMQIMTIAWFLACPGPKTQETGPNCHVMHAGKSLTHAERDKRQEGSQLPSTNFQIIVTVGGGPMKNQVVPVPVSVLLDPRHTACTKVVWMALRLQPSASPATLETLTALSRHTVLIGMAQVAAGGFPTAGPRVKVPGPLLQDQSVGAYAKVLYGLLQATGDFTGQSGQFTYTSLSSFTHICRNTLKRAIAELAGAGWVQVSQKNQFHPIRYSLSTPTRTRNLAALHAVEQRLKRAKFGGEAIMQEYLSLLIDSDQFTDNARPGFLINPLTGERLELDRFYPPKVAFEFHGAQHFRQTERYSQAEVDAQHVRDLIKAGLCLYGGIDLTIIEAQDLSLQGMTRKVARCGLPLRDWTDLEPVLDLLENASLTYLANARASR